MKRKQMSSTLEKMFDKAEIPVKHIEQSWDEVDGLYNSIAEYILSIGININSSLTVIRAAGHESNIIIAKTIQQLTNDIHEFTSELLKIKKIHENKRGLIENEQDLALCIDIFTMYCELEERFTAVSTPAMFTITEFLFEIEAKNRKTGDTITDVEIIKE